MLHEIEAQGSWELLDPLERALENLIIQRTHTDKPASFKLDVALAMVQAAYHSY